MIIAIDGPAGAGKSTLAKALAKIIRFLYLDTGATYRAVALFTLENEINPDDAIKCTEIAQKCRIDLKQAESGDILVFLNGRDVTEAIRSEEVSDVASRISIHHGVRQAMAALQRKIAEGKNIVAEGRDMGSVVFPGADVKIYLDAPLDERSCRRKKQLVDMGDTKELDQVRKGIEERDMRDKMRKDSPLVCMPDAIYINNGMYAKEETLEVVLNIVRERLKL
jgi:cytidylate kinase